MRFGVFIVLLLLLALQPSVQFRRGAFLKSSSSRNYLIASASFKPFAKKSSGGFTMPANLWKRFGRTNETDLYTLQERLERDCYSTAARKIYSDWERYLTSAVPSAEPTGTTRDAVDSIPPSTGRILLAKWFVALTRRIESEDIYDCALRSADESNWRPAQSSLSTAATSAMKNLVNKLGPQLVAIICLQELTRVSGFDISLRGIPAGRLADTIGRSLQRELITQCEYQSGLKPHLSNSGRDDITPLGRARAMLRNKWAPRLLPEVGMHLLWIAVNSLHITPGDVKNLSADVIADGNPSVPAFRHTLRPYRRMRKLGVVEWHPAVYECMMAEPDAVVVEPWALPMVIPPKPWRNYNSGGYLYRSANCVRLKDNLENGVDRLQQCDRAGRLNNTLRGLNVLGSTPWRVNEAVLRVALHMQQTPDNPDNKEPGVRGSTSSGFYDTHKRESWSRFVSSRTDNDADDYQAYVIASNREKEQLQTDHLDLTFTKVTMEIARQFAGLTFYLPHSVDFRGRAYPIPPYLSHLGNDLTRGLMLFAKGKSLGSRGWFWLKVHLANVAGQKGTLEERVEFTERNIPLILDSADYPLAGKQWWRNASDPWQCLAACTEVAAAVRSDRPEDFVSHIPCQQDGSCNGLQHYAALGRDVQGAKAVNLAASSTPQDVYSAVATMVSRRIAEDAGQPGNDNAIARHLDGKVNHRKLFKQPVMTSVYGVTPYTVTRFMEQALMDLQVLETPSLVPRAAKYLTQLTFECLATMFHSARQIQSWLGELAEEIVNSVPPEEVLHTSFSSLDEPERLGPTFPQTFVTWTTPTGFQVTQPYQKHSRMQQIQTALQTVHIPHSDGQLSPVDKKKQIVSFAANFIHSLDASHMFKTAISCSLRNITFASVHDSFWTHPADVDSLNRLLREEFVNMYSGESILVTLLDEFEKRYGAHLVPIVHKDKRTLTWRPIRFPPVPKLGSFNAIARLAGQDDFEQLKVSLTSDEAIDI